MFFSLFPSKSIRKKVHCGGGGDAKCTEPGEEFLLLIFGLFFEVQKKWSWRYTEAELLRILISAKSVSEPPY